MEKKKNGNLKFLIAILVVAVIMSAAYVITDGEDVTETGWALLPPLIAITLALVTKEVYSSLFIGIISGALLYTGFNFEGTVNHTFKDGVIAVLSDSYNVGILVFLVILGAMVQLMNKAGGSAAFGEWASKHIKTRVGAQLATIVLGVLIFIDDYFNCLTVGSVMRPVTDKHQVSRAKLAYLIDATAAPVCIIAPISSWAAAVSGFVKGENGLKLFISSIPYNYYAILTIIMMVSLTIFKADFGPMAKHERNALKGDIYTTPDRPFENFAPEKPNTRGKVIDLVIPIISLIVCCIIGMIYTGGFFEGGVSFIDAFANSDASVGLVYGSFFALVITVVLYLIRNVLSFKDCMDCVPEGFKAMVPAILILTFAWSLKAMTDSLGAKEFVAGLISGSAEDFMNFLPAIIFLIACFLSFATGTSWGTFGILIPIVVDAFNGQDRSLMIIAISACMAGAVCGDHCSPISDTTIMASAGAQCNHVNHVSTQLPYALVAAIASALTFLAAGFIRTAWISLLIGIAIMAICIVIIKLLSDSKKIEFREDISGEEE
ncbi:MAG: Na+/H+ antiporter NhaC family protein [Eubacterium sp.]|nr:Na+/H+ antiporter NhaC family protein [Eubacterium sp.]